MRTPRADLLPPSNLLRVLALDVTDAESIRLAIDAAGPVDVLVNNAGIGMLGALEGTSLETIRAVFDTNTFGTMALIQAVLPQFRQRKAGVIINVTSSVTLKSLPLLAAYTASKAAVNAFTESLALELLQFNIRMNLVLPGRSPETSFGENARARLQGAIPEAYAEFAQEAFSAWAQSTSVTRARDVSDAVWRAVNDATAPMRIAAGEDAVALTVTS
jgi:NAD(P)-dependent dehydrogenase (short-subunit alcohol dehydrogenase family)